MPNVNPDSYHTKRLQERGLVVWQIELPKDLAARIDALARQQGLSRVKWVRQALKPVVQHEEALIAVLNVSHLSESQRSVLEQIAALPT